MENKTCLQEEKESEGQTKQVAEEEEEEEYVMLNLDRLPNSIEIPPNAPYVLSGLDTLNPILIIDNKIKLVGKYEETIGTCLVFQEHEAHVVHEETGPSEANLFSGIRIMDPQQTPVKQIKPIAKLHKILRFRPFLESDDEDRPRQGAKKPS
ncbi:hypothetical protein ACJIZ3_014914 [Penstemon smallii]|uniref:Transcription factor TFIIIC triple barrel domain-containing protein n=1 Tax=Penstemon smallii TaxID=265156 RepID=A0ABD3RPE0_9LAMI